MDSLLLQGEEIQPSQDGQRQHWRERSGGGEQRNKHKQKASVTGRANVTSSHDWCDCIYSINIGILTHFLQPPLPSSSPPLCHVCRGPSATSGLKEMASIMKHHLRRCWSCSAARIDYVSPFAVNGVKVARKEFSMEQMQTFGVLSAWFYWQNSVQQQQ